MVSQTKEYPKDLESLLDTMPYLTPNDRSIIQHAYNRAEKAHEGQTRKSGEAYFTHCVAVASILAEMRLDSEAIAAGLLHDIVEDTKVSLDDLRSEFGEEIAKLVDGVTKLTNLPIEEVGQNADSNRNTKLEREMEYFRKMFLTMNDDIRVVIIKLADRLHNMRTLGFMPEEKQRKTAQETMDFFAPLANRLGIWQIKWELEDISFRYLEPDAYRAIARSLDERRTNRETYLKKVEIELKSELEKHHIQGAQISGRPKHIYSIYRKMKRKDLPLEEIYDIRALRVIVQEEIQCYQVLGIVHKLWKPIPGEFDDYIATPKDNFYRSLHTAVYDNQGKTLEVQIRTREMHENSEFGVAAHWRYKEGRRAGKDKAFEDRIAYLRQLIDESDHEDVDATTFVNRIKSDVFEDRVYAFTPKGDIYDLPVGATPIDFAYHIHTEIGHTCRGAKVNGKLVPLNYQLKTGDQVSIMTAKRGGPSMDWLNQDLGYAKTQRALSKIRLWLRKQNREQHITMGRVALERELKRMGMLDRISFEAVANMHSYDKVDNFLAAIGAGIINGSQISNKLIEEDRRRQESEKSELERIKPRSRSNIAVEPSKGVNIMGAGGMLITMARCCSPAAGDNIIGYVTRGRGVTVHRADCPNIQNISDTERLIAVNWGPNVQENKYIVPTEIVAQDREGLLRDISTLIAEEHINIASVEVVTRQQVATLYISLEISNSHQLSRILNKIEMIPNVYEARRLRQN